MINGLQNLFVRNMQTGTVSPVTESPDGTQPGNGLTDYWQLSESGQFVVFESNATNLVTGFNNRIAPGDELYLRNLATGVTTPLTKDSKGNALPEFNSYFVSTPDDRFVFFDLFDLFGIPAAASADPLTLPGIYVIDTQQHTTTPVLIGHPGVLVAGVTLESVSSDGKSIAFSGSADRAGLR